MLTAQEYEKRVWEIIESIAVDGKIEFQCNSVPEVKLHKSKITQVQKELRLVKKDIGLTKKALNAVYVSERTNVGKSFGSGIAAGLFGRKTMGKVNSVTRDHIRRQQLNVIAPYESVSRLIWTFDIVNQTQ